MTSNAQPELLAKRSALSELWLGVRRERALIALFALGRQKSRDLRAARMYAFGVFATYALAIALTGGAARQPLIHSYVRAALVALSWVVGALASLGSAGVQAELAEHDGRSALALQRGFSESALVRARTVATAQRIALLIGLPALLLGLWVGVFLYGRLDDAAFRKVILILLLVSGLSLVLPAFLH